MKTASTILTSVCALLLLLVIPALINFSSEGHLGHWFKTHLRSAWFVITLVMVGAYSIRPAGAEIIMEAAKHLHLLRTARSYVIVGLIGAILACLYWYFLDRLVLPPDSGQASVGSISADAFASLLAQKMKEGVAPRNPSTPITSEPKRIDRSSATEPAAQRSDPNSHAEGGIRPGDGFVQIEQIKLLVPSDTLAVGQTLNANYYMANRGGLPVYDVQSWGLMQVLDQKHNPGSRLRKIMLDAAATGYKQFRGDGSTLGVGMQFFNSSPMASPLTQEQIDGLKSRNLSLVILIAGAWRDGEGKPFYWSACQAAVLSPTLDLSNVIWKLC